MIVNLSYRFGLEEPVQREATDIYPYFPYF